MIPSLKLLRYRHMAKCSKSRQYTFAIDSKRVGFARPVSISTVIAILMIAFCVLIALLIAISKSDATLGSINAGVATIEGDQAGRATSVAPDSVQPNFVDNDGTAETELNATASKDIQDHVDTAVAAVTAEPFEEKSNVAADAVAKPKTAEQKQFLITPLSTSGASSPWRPPSGTDARNFFSGRDADSRKKLVETGGGSVESEAAVELGLAWLARHQHKDGHWSLDAFHQAVGCDDGSCTMPGASSDTAGTALGVLPFLAAGHTHRDGTYRGEVSRAIEWLIHDLDKTGSFKSNGAGSMYAQGQGAIALCEILAMTRDRKFRPSAQRAIDFIVSSQHSGGGWRYSPRMAGDTSVLGWQVLALKSAMQAGLKVPKSTFSKAAQFLDSVQADKSGATYGYKPGDRGSPTMSAEGLLSRIYTGWKVDTAGVKSGTEYLLNFMPQAHREIYYWYYATQVMHESGGAAWTQWNAGMRDFLIERQEHAGHARGSWPVAGGHDGTGGRLYATSLCLLTLQVYYRHTSVK